MSALAESALAKRDRGLVIVGAGAHARKLWHYAVALGLKISAFVDDNPQAVSPSPEVPCMSISEARHFGNGQSFIVAIGDPVMRRRLLEDLEAKGWVAVTLTHPTAYVAADARIQVGAVVCAHAVVETGSSIGIGTIVDVGAIVDHDCVVGAYCHLMAGCLLRPNTQTGNDQRLGGRE